MCTEFLGKDLQKFSLRKPRGYANNTEINIRLIDFDGIRCMERAVDLWYQQCYGCQLLCYTKSFIGIV